MRRAPAVASPGGFALVDAYAEALRAPPARRELRAWSLIALAALAVAGVFALLLALSRLPGAGTLFPWPVGFFEKGLVIHVVFSFVVWFLAVMAALATAAAYRAGGPAPRAVGLGPTAVWLGVAACVMLALPALHDGGEASLNNYVPVIMDPLFYAGLGLLALAMVLVTGRLLVNLAAPRGVVDPVVVATAAAVLLFVAALVVVVFDALAVGGPVDAAFNEAVFWSGGHLLQFVNVTLLLVAWYLLGGVRLAAPPLPPRLLTMAAVFLLLAGLVGVGSAGLVHEPFSVDHRQWITDLQYLLAPPTLLVAVATAWVSPVCQSSRVCSPIAGSGNSVLVLFDRYMLSRTWRMIVERIFCRSMTKSAMERPKNLCGIGTGVIELNGIASASSISRISLPVTITLSSSAILSPSRPTRM